MLEFQTALKRKPALLQEAVHGPQLLETQADGGGAGYVGISSFLYSCVLSWGKNEGTLLLVKITQ